MTATVRRARTEDVPALMALRYEVFCVEQGVPTELERDERDARALHLVAEDRGEVVGTCRLIPGEGSWTLGRMAVRADRRGTGIGRRLVELAHAEAREGGARRMTLAAQVPVQGFYAGRGYISRGEIFMDAGIPHIRMDLELI